MKLVFDIVKSGKSVPAKRNFHFQEEGGSIGRNEDNDWVLNDPNSYISGMHAKILCKHGTYFIRDESTNGTFLKHPYKKLPKGHPVKINASDVFIIGDHELQARFSNNDYNQDDLISSVAPTLQQNDNIIPDDFMIDLDSDFPPVSPSSPAELDVMSVLESEPVQAAPSFHAAEVEESGFIDVALEDENSREEVDISSFFSEPTHPEPVHEVFEEVQEASYEEHFVMPSYVEPEPAVQPKRAAVPAHGLEGSIAILESKLGIQINTLEQKERDSLMAELGDIITSSLDALQNSIQLKEKTQQDLHLSTNHVDDNNTNPVKLGAAATKLLQDKDKSTMLGMMSVSEGIKKSIAEMDAHCVALHSTSKNIMKIAATKFSPMHLEYRFESSGALRGVLPRQQLLWKAYTDMFERLNDRPDEGVEMIREDVKKEYENIAYSLKLGSAKTRKRV